MLIVSFRLQFLVGDGTPTNGVNGYQPKDSSSFPHPYSNVEIRFIEVVNMLILTLFV